MGNAGNVFKGLGQLLTAPFRWLARLPTWFVSYPGRLMGLSLPARAGCLVALLLVLCVAAAVLVVIRGTDYADIWVKVNSLGFYVAVALTVAIPLVVYFWLKFWLEGEPSRFPDIDSAWKEGLAALRDQGLDLGNMPLFLVLGASDAEVAGHLFSASALEFRLRDVPRGRPPIRWYASDRGVFLVCLEASQLSKLNELGRKPSLGRDRKEPPASGDWGVRGTERTAAAPRETITPRSATESALPGEPAGDMLRGTLVPNLRGTLVAGGSLGAAAPAAGGLTRHEAEEQRERLRYVCTLLRRARDPLCPLNGALVVLPFDRLLNVMVAREMPAAIKGDLAVVRETARLRFPVTALVTGMEQEPGFCELVRRVGRDKAKNYRIGKGHDVGNPPTEEAMDAFASHACGAIEDFVYSLFRERDGLSKPGNAKLYTLLCKIRGHVAERLRMILVHGFGFDPADRRAAAQPLLFNGCYFAACGGTEDRQAFVKSVFEKMLDLEDDVEWTEEALAEDDRYQRLSQVVMLFDGALILALIAMFLARVFR